MEKILQFLGKPARLIFIICAFAYATFYAVVTAASIGGTFISVASNLMLFVVGVPLLVAAPIFLLLKKEEGAKIAFVFLISFWIIYSVESLFATAENWCVRNADGLLITIGVFCFLLALALIAVLVLLALEYILKKSKLRVFSFFVLIGFFLFSFITFILYFIFCIKFDADWTRYFYILSTYLIAPLAVLFGCLYFFNIKPKEE